VEDRSGIRPWQPWLLAGFVGLAGLAVLHVWTPSNDPAMAVCLSRRLFHLPCPGCGLTRAFAHLAKGEWRAAITMHPLAPFLALEAILGWLAWGAALLLRRPPFRLPVTAEALAIGHAVALCAVWVVRLATGTLPW
jgi:hypothetical protein